MRSLAALLALSALITSPVVAETRLFCRYTGGEITDCVERDSLPAPVLTEAGCCDHRVSLPLDSSRAGSSEQGVTAPVLLAQLVPERLLAVTPVRPRVECAVAGTGPPLFVQHRALLI